MDNTTNTIKSNTPELAERARNILNASETVVSKISHGNRRPVKDIATDVGMMLGLTPVQVFPYVNDFCHCTTLGYVSPGKYGGYISGPRPLKTAKIPTTMPSTETVETIETSTDNTNS